MRQIYISFLGAGNYTPVEYKLHGKKANKTCYVQSAEIELLNGADYFNKVFMVMTKTSREKHLDLLTKELNSLGVNEICPIEITEAFSPEDQWGWFEDILSHVDHGDELTVDLTHGFRIVPIVFSTAINFLQKAKNITIKSVFYGLFDETKKESPIIDAKDFFIINEWTDAVSRLVEDADPGKLSRVAKKDSTGNLSEFNDPQLVKAFTDVEMKKKAIISNKYGRKERKKAEVFINMLQYDEDKWNFSGSNEEIKNGLKPLYEKMADAGIAGELKNFCKELVDYRNGFDHAWTGKNGASQDIELKGNEFLVKLENVVSSLEINGIVVGKNVA